MEVARSVVYITFAGIVSANAAIAAAPDSNAAPPVITKQPVSQTVKRLGSVTFTVTAKGSGPLTYQWHRSDATWPHWNRRSLTLSGVSENDVGSYTVTVSNAAGAVTSTPVTLTLRSEQGPPAAAAERSSTPAGPAPASAPPPPVAPSTPAPTRVDARHSAPLPAPEPPAVIGQTVTFVATADGSPPFTFQWKKDGKPLAGETNAKLVLRDLKPSHAGEYVCVISNSAGSAPSEPFILEIVPAPEKR